MTLMQRIDLTTVSAFRSAELNAGANVVSSVIAVLDTLSSRIAQLPPIGASSVQGIEQHISAVRSLANAWPISNRPQLIGSMQALKGFGDTLINQDAPALQAAFQRMASNIAGAQQEAVTLIDGLIQRLAGPAMGLEATTHNIGNYLTQLSNASATLGSDTTLVSQRIQSDQTQSALLAQQANNLQGQLNDARDRAKWYWLLGPLAALIAREIDSLASNLDGVTNQLNQIRADQANTIADANYLQNLLPALSSYLSGVNQMGAGVNASLAGTQTLQSQLTELKGAILSAPDAGAFAGAQLQAALADWSDISEKIGQLPQTAIA